jgi:hypothetical protein
VSVAPPRSAARKPPARPQAKNKKKKKTSSTPVIFYAVAAGLVVVVLAVAAVLLLRGRDEGPAAKTTASRMGRPAGSGVPPTSYSSSPSSGVFGPINQRSSDQAPLTVAELFPDKTITDTTSKATLARRRTQVDGDCAKAMWGSNVGKVLRQGDCTQAVRAVYTDPKKGYAVTIGVFNLAGSTDADRAVEAFGNGGFVKPLSGVSLGEGFSIGRGLAMGHFAVVTWVKRIDGKGDEQDEALLSLLVTGAKAEAIYARAAA